MNTTNYLNITALKVFLDLNECVKADETEYESNEINSNQMEQTTMKQKITKKDNDYYYY